MSRITKIRVDFSLKREVFFVAVGAILGAILMILPISLLLEVRLGLPYSITWIAFSHIVVIAPIACSCFMLFVELLLLVTKKKELVLP